MPPNYGRSVDVPCGAQASPIGCRRCHTPTFLHLYPSSTSHLNRTSSISNHPATLDAIIHTSSGSVRREIGSSTMADTSGSGAPSLRYPPIHAFPPFYTLQHNPVSRGQQLSQWRALILDYCRHYRIFTLSPLPGTSDAATSDEAADPHKSLFANRSIQRSLSPESIRQVLADLVQHKQAAWEDQLLGKSKSGTSSTAANAKAYIYWKTPAQWGDAIYDWVFQTGQNKSIMTLFELNQGDLVQGQGKCFHMFRSGGEPSERFVAPRLTCSAFGSFNRVLRDAITTAPSSTEASELARQGTNLCWNRNRGWRRCQICLVVSYIYLQYKGLHPT